MTYADPLEAVPGKVVSIKGKAVVVDYQDHQERALLGSLVSSRSRMSEAFSHASGDIEFVRKMIAMPATASSMRT